MSICTLQLPAHDVGPSCLPVSSSCSKTRRQSTMVSPYQCAANALLSISHDSSSFPLFPRLHCSDLAALQTFEEMPSNKSWW
ncbi:hypothetical protein U9M48_031685 [Paspalum notatum var. saurae]|uniref:Uncharacterized protein n=1 Tax=Paspalum notatum var. saurae TaxID=547442 RepID=A0AAQ3X4M1_PASNO